MSINWINQPEARICQVYYLSFKYSSICFGHPHVHHQELQQTAVAASGLPLERGDSSWSWSGRPNHNQQHCYHHTPMVNQKLLMQFVELLMMGMRMPKTCWAVFMLCFFTMHYSIRLIVRSELDVPTFATRRLQACNHARAPSSGRWNCGREMSGNFA